MNAFTSNSLFIYLFIYFSFCLKPFGLCLSSVLIDVVLCSQHTTHIIATVRQVFSYFLDIQYWYDQGIAPSKFKQIRIIKKRIEITFDLI